MNKIEELLNVASTDNTIYTAVGLACVGAAIGLGQLLSSKTPITLRLAVGRAIVSGGLGLAAAGALAFFPDMSAYAQIGVGAALASIGTSGLERLLKKFTGSSGGYE